MPGTTIYAALAARIRDERKRLGWTLDRLAARAGISTGFLAYLEQNKKKPSLATIDRLAHALGLPIADLFQGPPARRPPGDPLSARVASLLRDVPPGRRRMAYRVLHALSKKEK